MVGAAGRHCDGDWFLRAAARVEGENGRCVLFCVVSGSPVSVTYPVVLEEYRYFFNYLKKRKMRDTYPAVSRTYPYPDAYQILIRGSAAVSG